MIESIVKVKITNNVKYYKALGYKIPTRWSKWKKGGAGYVVAQGEEIEVFTKHLPKNSSIKVKVTCDSCGTCKEVKYQTYSKYEKVDNIYRCHPCAAKVNAKKTIAKKGVTHHNWNPNRTLEERAKIKEHRYHEDTEILRWRKAVYERDEFSCQACGVKGYKLNAHHINCWALFKLERYNLDNGVTLCNNCHKELHKKYGRKTTKKDWREYIQKKLRG